MKRETEKVLLMPKVLKKKKEGIVQTGPFIFWTWNEKKTFFSNERLQNFIELRDILGESIRSNRNIVVFVS